MDEDGVKTNNRKGRTPWVSQKIQVQQWCLASFSIYYIDINKRPIVMFTTSYYE